MATSIIYALALNWNATAHTLYTLHREMLVLVNISDKKSTCFFSLAFLDDSGIFSYYTNSFNDISDDNDDEHTLPSVLKSNEE